MNSLDRSLEWSMRRVLHRSVIVFANRRCCEHGVFANTAKSVLMSLRLSAPLDLHPIARKPRALGTPGLRQSGVALIDRSAFPALILRPAMRDWGTGWAKLCRAYGARVLAYGRTCWLPVASWRSAEFSLSNAIWCLTEMRRRSICRENRTFQAWLKVFFSLALSSASSWCSFLSLLKRNSR